MLDEFWKIILETWTVEEVAGWSVYADAVESGTVGMHWPV